MVKKIIRNSKKIKRKYIKQKIKRKSAGRSNIRRIVVPNHHGGDGDIPETVPETSFENKPVINEDKTIVEPLSNISPELEPEPEKGILQKIGEFFGGRKPNSRRSVKLRAKKKSVKRKYRRSVKKGGKTKRKSKCSVSKKHVKSVKRKNSRH